MCGMLEFKDSFIILRDKFLVTRSLHPKKKKRSLNEKVFNVFLIEKYEFLSIDKCYLLLHPSHISVPFEFYTSITEISIVSISMIKYVSFTKTPLIIIVRRVIIDD